MESPTKLRVDSNLGLWFLTLWSATLPLAALVALMYVECCRFARRGVALAVTLLFGVRHDVAAVRRQPVRARPRCAARVRRLAAGRTAGRRRARRAVAAGFLAGAAVVVEYELAIVVVALAVYLLVRDRRRLLPFAAGGVLPAVVLAGYQWRAFGAPWRTPAAFYNLKSGYEAPSPADLWWMFGGGRGLWLGAPIAIVGIGTAAWLAYSARGPLRDSAIVALAVMIPYLAALRGLVRARRLLDDSGPRYLIPALPFLAVPLAAEWDRVRVVGVPASILGVLVAVDGDVVGAARAQRRAAALRVPLQPPAPACSARRSGTWRSAAAGTILYAPYRRGRAVACAFGPPPSGHRTDVRSPVPEPRSAESGNERHDRRPRGARAQPPQRRPRAAARSADRVHRAVGLGQVVARVRHDLRRGPAPLRRVAVGVRPAVPRADGQARRRLHRGPVAGDLDRPEVGVAQPALDRRHDHRDLRLPAPALRAHRRSRTARTAAGSSRARRRSRSSTACCSCPTARASRCSRRSCAAARASTTRCSTSSRARASRGPASTARSSTCRRSSQLERYEQHTIEVVVDRLVRRVGHRAPAHRLARDRAEARRGCGRGRDRPQGREGRSRARDARVLRAPRVHALRAVVRGARAAQLLVQLALRRVRDVRRARHEVPGRPRARRSPTTTSRSTTARSRRGRASAASTSSACSTAVGDEHGFSTVDAVEEAEGRGRRRSCSTARAASR